MTLDRRRFLRRTALAGAAGTAALAGCSGNGEAPPRKSRVFEEIRATDGGLTVALEPRPTVQSRADLSERVEVNALRTAVSLAAGVADAVAAASPVGVAAAKGATGRGRAGGASAARASGATGRNDRAKYRGGTGSTWGHWHDEHGNEVDRYRANVRTVAIARLGGRSLTEEDLPGPGPVDGWRNSVDDPGGSVSLSPSEPGWYRVGAKLTAPGVDHDFGWEAVDGTYTGDSFTNQWKVSPAL